jgi:hypothetical protein
VDGPSSCERYDRVNTGTITALPNSSSAREKEIVSRAKIVSGGKKDEGRVNSGIQRGKISIRFGEF